MIILRVIYAKHVLICIQVLTAICLHVKEGPRVGAMDIVPHQASASAILVLFSARGRVDTVFLSAADPARILEHVPVLLTL